MSAFNRFLPAGNRFAQYFDRMRHLVRCQLIELQPAAQAVGYDTFGIDLFYLCDQSAAQMNRCLMKPLLKAHYAGHPAK